MNAPVHPPPHPLPAALTRESAAPSPLAAKWREARNLAKFIVRQRTRGFDVPSRPHFDPQTEPVFEALLRQAGSYLEYGSGGSTVLAARLGVPTVTVESDRFYARSVRAAIGERARNRMLVPDIGVTREWGTPLFKRATPARLRRWRRCVEAPFALLAEEATPFPDLVLVDGRFRVACALACAREAALRGQASTLCLDDYVGRPWYHSVEQFLGTPRLAGRMAIFDVSPAKQHFAMEQAIDAAIADWR